jgi:type I restriction enzyme S subunit
MKYKSSSVDWIGNIPTQWEVTKLKYLFYFEKGKNAAIYTSEYIGNNQGDFPVFSGQTENEGVLGKINSYDYDFNLVLFVTTVGAKAMTLRLLQGKFSLSQNCALIIKKNEMAQNSFYYYYLQRHFDFEKNRISLIMQPSLRFEDLNTYKIYLPSYEEQTAIANYLDEKTAQINNLIANKQKLIELLKEERMAIINQTVTKGINPKVKLKSSGIEWIEDIPEHWEVKKLKYIAKIISGAAFDSSSFSKIGSVKVLKIANIQHDYIDWTDTEYLPDNFAIDYERCRLFSGDIVFALTRPIISTGIKSARIVFNENDIVLLNQRNAILRATKYLDDSFIYFVTHSSYFYHMFETSIDDTGQQPNISPVSIMNFEIILPPYEEQIEISRHMEAETQRVHATISKIEKEIELLQEYRTAVISEAVTGKIKVA